MMLKKNMGAKKVRELAREFIKKGKRTKKQLSYLEKLSDESANGATVTY